jgi:glycosyltransferase 2 family protein
LKTKRRLKKIQLLLKIIVSIGLLFLVFRKFDVYEIIRLYQNANLFYLIFAIFLFILSQVISSFRLSFIFHQSGLMIDQISNLKLYLLGMFYNFFIPGGVGGDAYKVYVLKSTFNWKIKTLSKIIILDRLIGLMAIVFLCLMFIALLDIINFKYSILSVFVGIVFYILSSWIIKKIFKPTKIVYHKSFWMSILIQICQLLSLLSLSCALDIDFKILYYSLFFLISSILSVVSFSGFGVREYVFMQASEWLMFDVQKAVALGFSFSILTAIVSVFGFYFSLKKPKLKLTENDDKFI